MTEPKSEHRAVALQRDIRAIVSMLPALNAALAGARGVDRSGVRTPPASKPPISVEVSAVIEEVHGWAIFLARVLIDEIEWVPPKPATTETLLADIALARCGHFTEHPDEALALGVLDDARRLRHLVRRTIAPTGRRKIELGVACMDHGTSDLGERVACRGSYFTWLTPDEYLQDMICSHDPMHRMTPLEWQRAQRRGTFDKRAMEDLVRAMSRVGGAG